MSTPHGDPVSSGGASADASPEARLLAELLDASTELACAADGDGRIVYVNRTWERTLGYSRAEAMALPAVALVAPEHRAAYLAAARRLVTGETIEEFEAVLTARDGRRVVCRGRATPMMAPDPATGRPRCIGTRAVYRDVSAERRAEAARARLVAMFEATADFVGITRPGGRLDFLNRAGRRLLGLADDADVGSLNLRAFHPPETMARLEAEGFTTALRDGEWRGDGELLDVSGARIPVSIALTAHPGATTDDPTSFSTVMRDLRERVAVERALRDSDARFRAMLDNGRIAYSALRAVRDAAGAVVDFEYVEANAALERLSGMVADDVVGARFSELWPVAREDGLVQRLADVLRTGEAIEFERESRDPRVTARWTSVQVVPLADGVAVMARDVTPQKIAELELRLLQRVTHAIAEAGDVPEAGALALEAMCAAAGWEFGEMWLVGADRDGAPVLVHGPVWHAPGDERLAAFAAASAGLVVRGSGGLAARAWASGAPVTVPDLRAPGVDFSRADEARRARLTGGIAVPVLARGAVVAVLSFLTRDARRVQHADVDLLAAVAAQVGTVVHRKLAENALAQERAFLSTVLDSLSEHVSVCSPDGQLVLFNQATREAHGLPENPDLAPEEWSTYYGVLRPDAATPLPTEELPHVRALATRADVDDVEYVVAVPGRPHRTMVANVRVLHGPDGEFLGSVCAARDMTAQKAAEAALRASEERHRALFERSTAVQWIVDLETSRIVDANASAARFYGYALDAMRGMPLGEINILPAAAMRALHERAGQAPGGVVPHRLASGEVRMVEFHPTRVELDGRVYAHSVLHDVTDRIRVETALRQSESRLSLIYDSATDLMFLMAVERGVDDAVVDFRCESVNAAYLELSGLTADQIVGRTIRELLPADDAAGAVARYAGAATSGDVLRFEEELELAAGRLTVETTLTPVFDADGVCTHVLGSARDVSARLRAEAALRESEARFRGVLETVRSVAVSLDGEGRVTFANDALATLTGWAREEIVGRDWFAHFVPNGPALREVFARMLAGVDAVPHFESEILTRAGERRLIAWDSTLLHDASGAIMGTASIGRDITEQRALEARLAALSEHDELTGLLNRRGFRRMAEHELKVGRRAGRRGSLLYLDMDGFKGIHDEHGHGEGDLALRAVADVLRGTVREGDLAARLGGDEFVVYATGAATTDEGEVLASRLREHLARANEAAARAGRPYALGFSIGVAAVEGGDDLDAVLTRADAALYARKLARRAAAAAR